MKRLTDCLVLVLLAYFVLKEGKPMGVFRVAFWATVFGFIILFIASVIMVGQVKAHDWYDIECCDTLDCRPISGVKADGTPWSEIEDHGSYYIWKTENGTHTMEKADPRIKPSRDGFYHGCEVTGDHAEDVYARCIYVPSMF